MTENEAFNANLLEFIDRSPTPFHAVATMVDLLEQAGFDPLFEGDVWDLEPGGRYYVTRNDSSLIAFIYGRQSVAEAGVRLVGAHTDSPCLRVKPNPDLKRKGFFQLGVEVYGGALLAPWFDRDLSLAGRVTYLTDEQTITSSLIDFCRPVAVIPSLAIHLDREVNNNRSINAQRDLPPVLAMAGSVSDSFHQVLEAQLLTEYPDCGVQEVLDYELSFYDTQPGSVVGLHNEFLTSARLDNLLSCYVGLRALLEAGDEVTAMLVCSDHEEVGSCSACGAQGPMLEFVLRRLVPDHEDFVRCMTRSMLVSADNAHGIHPNYADKHDENHGPLLNGGPVIKVNANQRYASNSETQAVFRYLAKMAEVPVQSFVVRSDMACGSTIGPITAGNLGVRTIDVGVPTFAMHSVRELAGSDDAWSLFQVLIGFFRLQSLWGE